MKFIHDREWKGKLPPAFDEMLSYVFDKLKIESRIEEGIITKILMQMDKEMYTHFKLTLIPYEFFTDHKSKE